MHVDFLVVSLFTNGTNTAVAKMIDVILSIINITNVRFALYFALILIKELNSFFQI